MMLWPVDHQSENRYNCAHRSSVMPMVAKQSSINTTNRKAPLIDCHFDDPVLQAEFDALTNNEDRLDFIEGI